MLTISDLKRSDTSINNQTKLESFFLLIKPDKKVYTNSLYQASIEIQIEKLVKEGFKNVEICWSDNEKWFNYVSNLKLKFPKLNLGSASLINKRSID